MGRLEGSRRSRRSYGRPQEASPRSRSRGSRSSSPAVGRPTAAFDPARRSSKRPTSSAASARAERSRARRTTHCPQARAQKGASAAITSAIAQAGSPNKPSAPCIRVHQLWHIARDDARSAPRAPSRPHEHRVMRAPRARHLLGGTMNGTTCSRPSKPTRYEAAACWLANGPTRTLYQVPRPDTFASTT